MPLQKGIWQRCNASFANLVDSRAGWNVWQVPNFAVRRKYITGFDMWRRLAPWLLSFQISSILFFSFSHSCHCTSFFLLSIFFLFSSGFANLEYVQLSFHIYPSFVTSLIARRDIRDDLQISVVLYIDDFKMDLMLDELEPCHFVERNRKFGVRVVVAAWHNCGVVDETAVLKWLQYVET